MRCVFKQGRKNAKLDYNKLFGITGVSDSNVSVLRRGVIEVFRGKAHLAYFTITSVC